MNIEEISLLFSLGEFDKTFNFIADDAVWEIVGENNFVGKTAIISNCEQVSNYFKTVECNFTTHKVIVQEKTVIITGTAEFSRENKILSKISACDIYEFDNQLLIQKTTSYCIEIN
jgi:ketosteroid isomerase-like protein